MARLLPVVKLWRDVSWIGLVALAILSCKSWHSPIQEPQSTTKQTNAEDITDPRKDPYPGVVRLVMIGAEGMRFKGTGSFINQKMDLILTASHVVATLCNSQNEKRLSDCGDIFSAPEFNAIFGEQGATLSEERIRIDWRYFEWVRPRRNGEYELRESAASRALSDLKELSYRATIFMHPSAGAYNLSHQWDSNDQHDLALIQLHTAKYPKPGSWIPPSIRRRMNLGPLALNTGTLPSGVPFSVTLAGFGDNNVLAETGKGVKRVGRNDFAFSNPKRILLTGAARDNNPGDLAHDPNLPSKGDRAGNTATGQGDSGGPGLVLQDPRTGQEVIAGVTCCGNVTGDKKDSTLSRIDTNLDFFEEAYRKGYHVPATCCKCKTAGPPMAESFEIRIGKEESEQSCKDHAAATQKTCQRVAATACQYQDPRP